MLCVSIKDMWRFRISRQTKNENGVIEKEFLDMLMAENQDDKQN
jgi:hypothetical protein